MFSTKAPIKFHSAGFERLALTLRLGLPAFKIEVLLTRRQSSNSVDFLLPV